ncbi:putative Polyadenylate-binding protein, cytoplasmic and nuclear (putative) [Pseudozyma hubeiensis]|nr:putative Polyadenylate-binding protein, cytoplasmic and nuclear (putative) [Pseudozyma hubeiensis]
MADSIYAPHNQHKLQATRAKPADTASQARAAPEPTTKINDDAAGPGRSHPHLTRPLLYINGVDATMTDKELAGLVFDQVLPVRLKIDRNVGEGQTASGTVEFQTLEKAEKAYATVRPPILLLINPDSSAKEPRTSAKPRLVRQLPSSTDDASVYDLFRPFGPIRRAQCLLTNPAGVHTGFKGMAVVEFYREEDAQRAESEMHCREIDGKSISVAVDTAARKVSAGIAEFRPSAPAFVPASSMSPTAPSFDPTPAGHRSVSAGSSASIYASNTAAPASDTSAAPKASRAPLQYSSQAATYVDPCNLFIKNLDAELESSDLFDNFKKFGHIVSARVMRDHDGKSREFGFVSFTAPDEARQALKAMDNAKIRTKKITVRLHEPKTMRQEKLNARFNAANIESADAGTIAPPADAPNAGETQAQTDNAQAPKSKSAEAPPSEKPAMLGVQTQRSVSSTSSIGEGGAPAKERERLLKAVVSVTEAGAPVEDITDMIASLPKKDRAMALFNSEYLKQKVDEAKDILDITDDSGEDLAAAPAPPVLQDAGNGKTSTSSASPPPAAENAPTQVHTLSTLAALPAVEIIRLANSSSNSGLPLPKADSETVKSTDAFIDSLQGKAAHDQKQKLGDQLFKKIRTFGVKGAPKLTIHLLDTEDLRALAHLMNSYEEVLKEKVLQKAAAGLNK